MIFWWKYAKIFFQISCWLGKMKTFINYLFKYFTLGIYSIGIDVLWGMPFSELLLCGGHHCVILGSSIPLPKIPNTKPTNVEWKWVILFQATMFLYYIISDTNFRVFVWFCLALKILSKVTSRYLRVQFWIRRLRILHLLV